MLPEVSTAAEYWAFSKNDASSLPAVETICARHGIATAELKRQGAGSHIVFRSDTAIIKLFCPIWRNQFIAEAACLGSIHGLPIPELLSTGELENWPYLVTSVVPGVPANECWEAIGHRERASVIEQLGSLMHSIHVSASLPELTMDWNTFLEERPSTIESHHGQTGTWNDWISARVSGFSEEPFTPVLVHSDLTNENVFLEERQGHWHISGLIDFGDAMMGHPHYEFIVPFRFFTFGEPRLSRTLLESYGLSFTEQLARRLTTYCLLHRYGSIRQFFERSPVADGTMFHQTLWKD
jgi:hygromycin-B 7''-O-kinase